MTYYILESATETGDSIKYLSCGTRQRWVDDIEDATRFETFEEAEQLGNDWTDHFAMKGIGRLTNIAELPAKRMIDMTPSWPEALRMYRMLIENGTDEGKATAWKELERMAELAQLYTDAAKAADEVMT